MVSDKNQGGRTTSNLVSDAELTKKFNLLRKYIQNSNGRIHHLKRRLHLVSKEVKALKRARESHMRTVKKAERIERKLDAEKTKMRRKVLKAGKVGKPQKVDTSTISG